MIGAEDDMPTPELRQKLFYDLEIEFSTMHGRSLVQKEEYTPTPKERRLKGDDEEYFGRIIRVVEDEESDDTGEDEIE